MKLTKKVLISLLGISAIMATSCSLQSGRRPAAVSDDPLEAAWQFACAITNDPSDLAECQERVARAYLARGDYNTALKRGDQIANWRKAVVLAEAAALLAESGKTNAALERIVQAEAIARPIEDWQRDLILVRAVKAKALLGQVVEVGRVSQFYQGNRDYRGEVAAYHALSLARGGQITNAFGILNGLAGATNLDVSGWCANGYLLLAKSGQMEGAQVSDAFAQAWVAAEQCPGWQRMDVQLGLVESAAACGQADLARSWLDAVTSNVLTGRVPSHIKPPLLSQLSVRWGLLGQAERVAECARVADPLIRQLQSIDQPAPLALLGEAYVRLGDKPRGLSYYEQAMTVTEGLINRRPRAMACVAICLSLERARMRPSQLGDKVSHLLLSFGANHG